MTLAAQLLAIFAFGLVITGIVFLGILRAREFAAVSAKSGPPVDRDGIA